MVTSKMKNGSDGTGRYFDSSYMVTVNETVEANADDNGSYSGSLIKSLSVENIVKLSQKAFDVNRRRCSNQN